MLSGFIVKKGRMENVYDNSGRRFAVTRCSYLPLTVTRIDGKNIQLAGGSKKNLHRSVSGQMSKLKLDLKPAFFKEFKLISDQIPAVGDQISPASVFKIGQTVSATGLSKGRGFAGVIKRYGFQRQPVSGGQSDRVRAPGAIGAQTPGKVIKGKKMPGHYGHAPATVTGLKIVAIDTDKNQIVITGPVPGHFNSWLTITK